MLHVSEFFMAFPNRFMSICLNDDEVVGILVSILRLWASLSVVPLNGRVDLKCLSLKLSTGNFSRKVDPTEDEL